MINCIITSILIISIVSFVFGFFLSKYILQRKFEKLNSNSFQENIDKGLIIKAENFHGIFSDDEIFNKQMEQQINYETFFRKIKNEILEKLFY